MRTHRMRRRRPGESWNLWRVHGIDGDSRQDRGIGYLVTDRERNPHPIAYVAGLSRKSLRMALAIVNKPELADLAFDLRHRRGKRFCKRLLGMLLMLVDRRGFTIGNDRTFAAGMYRRQEDGRTAFFTYTHYGLELLREGQRQADAATKRERGTTAATEVAPQATTQSVQPGRKLRAA